MLLILLVFILVLGVAFYQSVQGLYSAIIMALLTVCCAVLAFNFYEPFAQAFLLERAPAYAYPISLVTLFILPLLGLRLITDKLLGANALTGMWTDRIAGGVVGLVTGMVLMGVLTIAVQMLPLGPSLLGYEAYDDSLQPKTGLFPYPDEFTIGMVNLLSAGKKNADPSASLATDPASPYSFIHDDLRLEMFCARNTGKTLQGESLPCSLEVMPDGLKVVGAYLPTDGPDRPVWATELPRYPLLPKDVSPKVVIVRIQLNDDSRAKDEDRYYRLAGTQFRLVTARGKSYYPIGYMTYLPKDKANKRNENSWILHAAVNNPTVTTAGRDMYVNMDAAPGKLVVVRPGDQNKMINVDWVYQIPAEEIGKPLDTPSYMVFRGVARAEIAPLKQGMPDEKTALDRKIR